MLGRVRLPQGARARQGHPPAWGVLEQQRGASTCPHACRGSRSGAGGCCSLRCSWTWSCLGSSPASLLVSSVGLHHFPLPRAQVLRVSLPSRGLPAVVALGKSSLMGQLPVPPTPDCPSEVAGPGSRGASTAAHISHPAHDCGLGRGEERLKGTRTKMSLGYAATCSPQPPKCDASTSSWLPAKLGPSFNPQCSGAAKELQGSHLVQAPAQTSPDPPIT